MNGYAQWEILNSSCTLTCHFRIKMWENVAVDEMYLFNDIYTNEHSTKSNT
jgi:hypothetical protein